MRVVCKVNGFNYIEERSEKNSISMIISVNADTLDDALIGAKNWFENYGYLFDSVEVLEIQK